MNGTSTLDWREEWRPLALLAGVFAAVFFLPVGEPRFDRAVLEGLLLVKEYAREHVLLCLVPAFFIAGAISVFVSDAAVMRYLGRGANRFLAYGVASVSGMILAVCSCTVLPLFASIRRRGAGLGPATAFLYSGPAINVLAITLTGSVLGWRLGLARGICAVVFAVVIGVAMALLFRRDEPSSAGGFVLPEESQPRPLWQSAAFFAALVAILVFANWARPQTEAGIWWEVFQSKWILTTGAALLLAMMLTAWFGIARWKVGLAGVSVGLAGFFFSDHPALAFAVGAIALSLLTSRAGGEAGAWFESSWGFAKQILPLLFAGVVVAGMLLGRPGSEGLIPGHWVESALGGSTLGANFFAAIAGAFMYFATLTEVPIVQGLLGNGMGEGPALALLLAGPALSLPNMLVIAGVLGWRRTLTYIALVVVMATLSGFLYGFVFP